MVWENACNTGTLIGNTNGGDNSGAITKLSSGTYQYCAKACGSSGCSNEITRSVTVSLSSPSSSSAPTTSSSSSRSSSSSSSAITDGFNLTISPSISYTGTYTVYWSGVSLGTNVMVWENACNTGTLIGNTNGSDNSGAITKLSSGTYQYCAKACGSSGCSNEITRSVTVSLGSSSSSSAPAASSTSSTSSSISSSAPLPPTNVKVEASADLKSINVSWGGSLGADYYDVSRLDVNQNTETVIQSQLSSVFIQYPDEKFSYGTTYIYKVEACITGTPAKCSVWASSLPISVALPPPPPPPVSIDAKLKGLDVTVTWPLSASVNADHYEVQHQYLDKVTNAWSTIFSGSGTTYLDTKLIKGGEYGYRVRACDAYGNCSATWTTFSKTIVIPTIPLTPASIAVKVNLDSLLISWPFSTGATFYKLQRNGADFITKDEGKIKALLYLDRSVTKGTSYTYSLVACNAAGCSTPAIVSGSYSPGTLPTGKSVTQTYEYNTLGRLEKVKAEGKDKTIYQYDSAGNRTSVDEKQ